MRELTDNEAARLGSIFGTDQRKFERLLHEVDLMLTDRDWHKPRPRTSTRSYRRDYPMEVIDASEALKRLIARPSAELLAALWEIRDSAPEAFLSRLSTDLDALAHSAKLARIDALKDKTVERRDRKLHLAYLVADLIDRIYGKGTATSTKDKAFHRALAVIIPAAGFEFPQDKRFRIEALQLLDRD